MDGSLGRGRIGREGIKWGGRKGKGMEGWERKEEWEEREEEKGKEGEISLKSVTMGLRAAGSVPGKPAVAKDAGLALLKVDAGWHL